MNALYYSSHPLVEQQHNNGVFHHKGNAFAMCLSNNALEYLTKDDPIKAVVAEAYNNAHNCQFSSFLCLMALSSSIKLLSNHIIRFLKTANPMIPTLKKIRIPFLLCSTVLFIQEKQVPTIVKMRKYTFSDVQHYL